MSIPSPSPLRSARVLVTCAGSTNALSIIKALRQPSEFRVWILGVDSAPADHLAGSAFCDAFVRVPSFESAEDYTETLVELTANHGIDWLVPMLDQDTAVLGAHRDRFPPNALQLPPQTTIELARDKWACAEWLIEHGFPTPPTALFDRGAPDAISAFGVPALVKPRIGFSSRGIVELRQPTDWCAVPPDPAGEPSRILQRIASGSEYTVDLFGDGREVHCAVPRRRLASKAGQIYQGESAEAPVAADTARRLGARLGVRGMFNVQGFLDRDRFAITDLNPRSSGGLPLTTASGPNLPLATLRLALGRDPGVSGSFTPTRMSRYWSEVFRPAAPTETGDPDGVVPVRDLRRERAWFGPDLDAAIRSVLDSGEFILGPEVQAFEQEFAAQCGAAEAIGVASGSDALVLALRGLGVGAGSEVIVPAHTAPMTVAAVQRAGVVPVLVDVDRASGLIDLDAAEAAVTEATRAIVPVHLYGQCLEPEALDAFARATNLMVLEDAAQAVGGERGGRRVGAMGAAAAFSFYPTKNLGGAGDGGIVTTSDPDLANAIRSRRTYGIEGGSIALAGGSNSRLDAMQAAILRVKLPHLIERARRRAAIRRRYLEALAGLGILPAGAGRTPTVDHLFVLRVRERDRFRAGLDRRRVETAVHYAPAMHHHPGFAGCRRAGDLAEAEAWARECVTLPLFPELHDHEVERVIDAVTREAPAHRASDT